MRLTRTVVRREHDRAMRYVNAHKQTMLRIARQVTRGADISWRDRGAKLHVEFLYDPIEDHWAETDCDSTMWLNAHKTFTRDLLMLTLAHEEMHGRLVRERGNHPLAEETEHRIMELVDAALV